MDPRERVIEAVAAGASRRETAEQFGLSASVVIIWAQRYHATGNYCTQAQRRICVTAGRVLDFILGLIKEQPDTTLDEIVAAMKKAKIRCEPHGGVAFLRPARHNAGARPIARGIGRTALSKG